MKRLEYDPERDGLEFAIVANQLAAYLRARHDENTAEAVRQLGHAEAATEQLLDQLLADLDGRLSRREMAAALGVTHGSVNYRISRHRRRLLDAEEDED
ncbi:winged helix-turn-helix transcriptional regulator [Saccharopolyspora pogona]|uniref:winged helix-turn-helix transcriptional regulator n=1 Tax=Saccharopolyspora pogona TaxID=333966 RepID=UPI001682E293|nr:winged helix-turn-helix transcriptional regulator [Saccharopolyspora pogona]